MAMTYLSISLSVSETMCGQTCARTEFQFDDAHDASDAGDALCAQKRAIIESDVSRGSFDDQSGCRRVGW